MSATQVVQVAIPDGPIVSVPWVQNMNAQQAMEGAFNVINNSKAFTFALQYYGAQLGYLVLMINGTFDYNPSNYYWEFFLNGNPSPVGIDSAILQPNDIIAFSFAPFTPSSAKETSAMLNAKHVFYSQADKAAEA